MANLRPRREILDDALVSGAVASLASTAALSLNGRREIDDAAAPLNGPSQWIWGRSAPYQNGFSLRHTVLGYLIHHSASTFWAVFYEMARQRRKDPHIAHTVSCAAATSVVASAVDYCLTPQRLRPGFEKRLSRNALVTVYAAFGIGLAAATLLGTRTRLRSK